MNHLILLHGALGSAEELSLLEKHLGAANLSIHRFNFKGHGNKGLSGAFGIDAFSEELRHFIQIEKIHKPFVFGYSMGGYVALKTALNNKDLFSGIVTLGTKFNWTEDFTIKETSKLKPEFLLEKAPDFVDALIKKHHQNWKSLLSHTEDMMFGLQKTHLVFLDSLTAIGIPVWIGRGDKDRMVSMEESLLVQQKIKGSGYFVLPETLPPFETLNHELLAAVLTSFMRRCSLNAAQANG